jgi:hypothetical protein
MESSIGYAVLIGVISGLMVAAILGVWSIPRKYIAGRIRAALKRPQAKLHLILGTFPPTWIEVKGAGDRRMIAWQCQIHVTNDGNRQNSPVKGVLRWNGQDAVFSTPLSFSTIKAAPVMKPDERALLKVSHGLRSAMTRRSQGTFAAV